MSRAGRSALQGFEYQEMIAIEHVIDLLYDDEEDPIKKISVDSVGLSDSDRQPDVDDIVITRESGKSTYVQAKKNRTDRQAWSLGDSTLKKELRSARDQLEADPEGEVVFVSRDPFGKLQTLADHCRGEYQNFERFQQDATKKDREQMKTLLDVLNDDNEGSVSIEEAFSLIRRIRFEITPDFLPFEKRLLRILKPIIAGQSETALALLGRFIRKHSTGDGSVPVFDFTREEVVRYLEKNGVLVTEERSVEEILDAFDSASKIGWSWSRKIDGKKIARSEVDAIYQRVKEGDSRVLVEGKPGSGKTCVLLDTVERFEEDSRFTRLFIKADRFADATSTSDLVAEGLPEDIPGQCAQLASDRRVVVIFDSLDVLSLSRNHRALKIFLGLIERLSRVPNVSVVAACRTFDRKYDPQLRAVEWDSEVVVQPFDFDDDVLPFLRRWDIDPDSIGESIKGLICIPQNLSLFSRIAQKGKALGLKTEYELQERFLQEVVVKDPLLGESALQSLQAMADELTENRSHSLSQFEFTGSEPTKQRLISQGVLYEPEGGSIAFSHQTLGDNLAARKSISDGLSFRDFVLSHPPYPFIRPAVRSFFFYLRARDHKAFRRDVWKVLDDDSIAYHLRRLVAESLCEIEPEVEDWPLLRRLFQKHSDLFKRFLQRVQSKEWIDILSEHWLPLAVKDEGETPWVKRYIRGLGRLGLEHADTAIDLWKRAFDECWCDSEDVAMSMISAIRRADSDILEMEKMPDVLEKMVQAVPVDHPDFDYPLGQYLSKSIDENPHRHDVLQSYLFKASEKERSYPSDKGLVSFHDIEPNIDFHRKDFLVDCLKRSPELLTDVIRQVEGWGQTLRSEYTTSPYNRGNLLHTRWDKERTDHSTDFPNPSNRFFSALEDALKHHSRKQTDWWKANEPRLRESKDLGVRYMFIQAYRENLADNREGVKVQICDTCFHRYSDMNYEVGCLMQEAFTLLSQEVRAQSQMSVLELTDEVDLFREGKPTRWAKIIYDCLTRVPKCYLISLADSYIQGWASEFGTARSKPALRSSGGFVAPPVSADILCGLSDEAVFRVLSYFRDDHGSLRMRRGSNVGGKRSLVQAVSKAAALDAARFLSSTRKWAALGLDPDFLRAMYRGAARHCMIHFGNVRQRNWDPHRPAFSKAQLAVHLLRVAETSNVLWQDLDTARRVVEACCVLSHDLESVSRSVVLVFRLLQTSNDVAGSESTDQDAYLVDAACTDAAAAAVRVAMVCFESKYFSELLLPLLKWTAQDSRSSVRKSLLSWLPSLIRYDTDLVWGLLDLALEDATPDAWSKAEKVLYYTYYQHFDEVNTRLKRLEAEAIGEESAEMLGRILTLTYLAEHVTINELFDRLGNAHANALKGAADVFGANLSQRNRLCTNGAVKLLNCPNLTEDAWKTLEQKCFNSDNIDHVPKALVDALVENIPSAVEPVSLRRVGKWAAQYSTVNPTDALDIIEKAVTVAEENSHQQIAVLDSSIIEAVLNVLREADMFDDEELASRSISVQDRMMKLDLALMDKMLDDASRER